MSRDSIINNLPALGDNSTLETYTQALNKDQNPILLKLVLAYFAALTIVYYITVLYGYTKLFLAKYRRRKTVPITYLDMAILVVDIIALALAIGLTVLLLGTLVL